MTPFEREIARQRAQLNRTEAGAAQEIAGAYTRVLTRLRANTAALTRQIEQAVAQGVEVRPGWLYAQQRYRVLISDLEHETLDFLTRTMHVVSKGQDRMVQEAFDHGRQLARLALGPAPRHAVHAIETQFDRLPAPALRRIVGNATNGEPLGMLLSEVAGASSRQVKDALAYGVAAGKHPRMIAREVEKASGVSLSRALTISRTEMLGAYRQSLTETYRETGVVREWQWLAKIDRRTCPVCIALSGTRHPLDEPLASHPNCRCTKVPVTPSWADLGFHGIPDQRPTVEAGQRAFARLPASDQEAILGAAKYAAYRDGRITLQGLVRPTFSPRWGAGTREASLSEALA